MQIQLDAEARALGGTERQENNQLPLQERRKECLCDLREQGPAPEQRLLCQWPCGTHPPPGTLSAPGGQCLDSMILGLLS